MNSRMRASATLVFIDARRHFARPLGNGGESCVLCAAIMHACGRRQRGDGWDGRKELGDVLAEVEQKLRSCEGSRKLGRFWPFVD